MKKFIINCLIYSVILAIVLNLKPCYLLYTEKYKAEVYGHEIYISIIKSKKKTTAKKVIIGDSVANQLFPNTENNDTLTSLACNRTISMLGQFLLLNNYFLYNNTADTVYLLVTPFSFSENLNSKFTFHYFLKPFYKNEYSNYFSETAISQLHKIPYYFVSQIPYFLTNNWSPDFVKKENSVYKFLSPISIEYLERLKDMSKQYNFKLVIVPTPTNSKKKLEVDNFKLAKDEIQQTGLENEFNDYFSKIFFLEDSLFIDGSHLKKPKVYSDTLRIRYIK